MYHFMIGILIPLLAIGTFACKKVPKGIKPIIIAIISILVILHIKL